MKKPRITYEHIAATIALLCVAILCASGTYFFLSITPKISQSITSLNQVAKNGIVIENMITRPCDSKNRNCGLLANSNLLVANLQITDNKANTTIDDINTSQKQISQHAIEEIDSIKIATNSLTSNSQNFNPLIKSATASLNKFQTIEDSTNDELLAAKKATLSLNKQINSAYIQNTEKSMAGIASNFDYMSDNLRTQYNSLVHPKPCKTFGCRFVRFGKVVPVVGRYFEGAQAIRSFFAGYQIYGSVKVQK